MPSFLTTGFGPLARVARDLTGEKDFGRFFVVECGLQFHCGLISQKSKQHMKPQDRKENREAHRARESRATGIKSPKGEPPCRSLVLPSTLHNTTLHYTTQHYTTLHFTTLHYTTLHYTTLQYTTLHYTTLHYTTLHYTTLHYTTLYTTLHCTATISLRLKTKVD